MNPTERLTIERDQARTAARDLASEIRIVLRHIEFEGSLRKGCTRVSDLKDALRKYEALKILEPS